MPRAVLVTDHEAAKEGGALEERAHTARAAKLIWTDEEQSWLRHLADLRDRGQFWLAMMVFTARGIKP